MPSSQARCIRPLCCENTCACIYALFGCVVMHTSMNRMANLVLKRQVMVAMVSILLLTVSMNSISTQTCSEWISNVCPSCRREYLHKHVLNGLVMCALVAEEIIILTVVLKSVYCRDVRALCINQHCTADVLQ